MIQPVQYQIIRQFYAVIGYYAKHPTTAKIRYKITNY